VIKLLKIIEAVLNEENKAIASGVLSYNPNTVGRKLINSIIKNYKETVNNKYLTYSHLLKNRK
jgi:hypothetical protein